MFDAETVDMKRQGAESLAQFCIAQRNAFDPQQWLARRDTDGKALALAAKYLSMTSWYGHEAELEGIALQIYADVGDSLFKESRSLEFDLPHFSTTVRLGIAQLRDRRPPPGVVAAR